MIFSDIEIEPTSVSIEKAIEFSKVNGFDGFVAIGGGSTMDTAKACNLYSV